MCRSKFSQIKAITCQIGFQYVLFYCPLCRHDRLTAETDEKAVAL